MGTPGTIARANSDLDLTLRCAPPYDWTTMCAYLAARCIPGVEHVDARGYHRTLACNGAHGSVRVAPNAAGDALVARVSPAGVAAFPGIVSRLRQLFDLNADVRAIGAHLALDPRLAPSVEARPGLRVPGAWDGFELAVRAILGQQVSVAAACTLLGTLVSLYGEPVQTHARSDPRLSHLFPAPERLRDADLAVLGVPRQRARALSALARAAAGEPDLFSANQPFAAARARLQSLPGIGEWTAQYIAMRALREPDAFPAADLGLLRAMTGEFGRRPKPRELLARAERWRPWRAYAAVHLWMGEPVWR